MGYVPVNGASLKYPLRLATLATLALLALMPQPWKGRLALHGYIHDLSHVLVFSAAFLANTWGRRSCTVANLTAVALILFGGLLEALQTKVYGNLFEFHDLVSDVTGVALGLLIRNMWEA